MDAHNLMHFMKLRLGAGAQHEIKVYARAIADIFKLWLPETYKAFEEYKLNAVTFSATEVKWIKAKLAGESVDGILDGMSKGERLEFMNKVGL
jgi:thymidylate synthase (FAD)